MKRFAWLFAFTILSVTLAKPLLAQTEHPILSMQRLSIAGGVSYDWYSDARVDDAAPIPPFGKEWSVGLHGAYLLTRQAAIVGTSVYGLDNKQFRHSVGVRIVLWRGSD